MAVVTQGENPTLNFSVQNNGLPFNITGATISVYFRKSDDTELTKTGSIVDAAAGTFSVALTADNVNSLKLGVNQKVRATLTISSRVYTVWYQLTVRDDSLL